MKNSDDFTVLSSFSQGYKSTQKGGVDQRGNDASGRDELRSFWVSAEGKWLVSRYKQSDVYYQISASMDSVKGSELSFLTTRKISFRGCSFSITHLWAS